MTKLKVFLIILVLLILSLIFSFKIRDEKTEVVFWTAQLSPFSEYISEVISEFEQSHPNIKIKWVDVPYSEAEKRVLASLLSNSMPDLVNITSDFNMTLATKGALMPIESGYGAYNKALVGSLTFDDKVWGLPFYATSAVTIYNRALMAEFGIKEPPRSYDELFSQMDAAEVMKNKYLFMPTLTENDTLYKILNKYGINTPQILQSEKAKEFFAELQKLYLSEKIPREAITQTHREVLEKYSSGQIVYLQAGANFLNIIKENSLDVYEKSDVAQQFYGENEAFDFSLMTLAVPAKARHREEALLFAKFITNAQNQLKFEKLTGVLPCNNEALKDSYFVLEEKNDLISKARIIGAKQLSNPVSYPPQTRAHKDVIVLLNSLVEQILLENKNIDSQIKQTSKIWSAMLEN